MENEEQRQIENLGKTLVTCYPDNNRCPGIDNCPSEGKIPRCINLDPRTPLSFEKGVIVVGMNPGKANEKELKIYLEGIKNGNPYQRHKEYFDEYVLNPNAKEHPYHKKTREVLNIIGFTNLPILWTEIVKCQSKMGERKLRISTIRNCVANFLKKEIEIFPKWPIVCVGNEAFRTCALLFPCRTIIGISHPSGSNNGGFKKFIEKIKKYPQIKIIENAIKDKSAINLANDKL